MVQNNKNVQLNFILSIIAFLELIISGVFTLLVSPDPKNAWLLGFSKQRWGLALIILLLALLFLISGRIAKKRNTTFYNFISNNTSRSWYKVIAGAVFILILLGWFSVFCPPYLFFNWANYYERIRPLSIAIGLIAFQFALFPIVSDNKDRLNFLTLFDRKRPFFRASLFFTVWLLVLAGFIGISKIGLAKDTAYWNVLGIPITGLQFFIVVIIIGLGIYFSTGTDQTQPSKGIFRFNRYLPFLIYFGTALVWGLTPMLKHFFSLQPTLPNLQPFPWSDARWLDLGGLSIIKGYGINFHHPSDKPLYMVFLAFLHVMAGTNYSLITWLQILVLSLVPAILFLFGKKFFNQSFGFFLAITMIIRQRNAIILSYKIASVNPKLLVSEMMTMLGIVLLAYLVFLWIRNPKPWLALLAGGVLGVTALIRMNLLLIFPVIGLLVIISLWKLARAKWSLLALYTLGFLIIVTPWLVTGVDQNGTPFVLVKINSILRNRYQTDPESTQKPPGLPLRIDVYDSIQNKVTPKKFLTIYQQGSTSPLNISNPSLSLSVQTLVSNEIINSPGFLNLFANHFLHNIVASTMILPDSLVYDDLDHLRLRPYWIEGSGWQGNLPPTQVFLILLNIIFIAIGLGYGWSRYRWAGLIPLVIFLGYDFSLTLAMNSGSRYIVPIDWIIYFYYGLTLICIIRWINNILHRQDQLISDEDETRGSVGFDNNKRIWQSFAILIMIASLIPIANNVLPLLIKQPDISDNTDLYLQSIPESQKIGTKLFIGEILYPYYGTDSTFSFDFLANERISSYSISLDRQPLKVTLSGGEKILIGKNAGNLDFIYLISGPSLNLIWDGNSSD